MTFDSLKDALDHIYSRRGRTKIKLGLERISLLEEYNDNPHLDYKVIHVAGTNGKGSVTKAVSEILKHHGYKVGMLISPHLTDIVERIRVNGNFISEYELLESINEIMPIVEKVDKFGEDMEPSFFEIITAVAFHYFRKKNIDVAVVEVGLGGTYDATNVVKSDVSVITTIHYDHTNFLGKDLVSIAHEKAGILKEGNYLVIGMMEEEPLNEILRVSKTRNVEKVYIFKRDFKYSDPLFLINRNLLNYEGINFEIKDLVYKTNGVYQPHNLSVAIATTEAFFEKEQKRLDLRRIREALKDFVWEGRFEILDYRNKKIILEGAHNISGAIELKKSLKSYFWDEKISIIVGILDDKDQEGIVRNIIDYPYEEVIVTRVPSERSKQPEKLYEIVKRYRNDALFIEDPLQALDRLLNGFSKYILVTGSLYLVGKIRGVVKK